MVNADSMLAMPLFSIGNVQTTLGSLLVVITVIFLTLLLGRLARNALQNVLQRVGEQDSDAVRGYLTDFGDSSVLYSVDVWIDDANDARGHKSDLRETIWWALKENDITIAWVRPHDGKSPDLTNKDHHLNRVMANQEDHPLPNV